MEDKKILSVISLGAGVQSTTMLLMALHGELTPKPDFAVFADTGWEPKAVYKHLQWLKELAESQGLPVIITSRGNIRDDILAAVRGEVTRVANPPLYTLKDGKKGMLFRYCTKDYKIDAVIQAIREQLGLKPRQRVPKNIHVEQWMGISTDEAMRMKPSRHPWITNRYPLIEKEMSRQDCLRWLKENGYPLAPKSSCIGCPYHNDSMWKQLKENSPDEWQEVVEFDKAIRNGWGKIDSKCYLHRSLQPIDEIDFDSPNLKDSDEDFFNNECEGMCGV